MANVPMLYERGNLIGIGKRYYWTQFAEADPEAKAHIENIQKYQVAWKDEKARPQEDEWVLNFPVGVNACPMRGVPPYLSVLSWAGNVNDLASLLRTYITTLVQWVWELKVKGTAADISTAQSRLGSNIDGTNPPATRPAVRISGQGQELKPIDISSQGARLFEAGFEISRLMVCAGTGIPVHYLMGDPSTGNLATAESMEFPVRKLAERWQMFWTGIHDELFRFAAFLDGIIVPTENLVEFDLPDLDTRDTPAILTSLAQAKAAGILADEDIARAAAYALNVGNVEEMVKRVMNMPTGQAGQTLSDLVEHQPGRAMSIIQRVYEAAQRKALKDA